MVVSILIDNDKSWFMPYGQCLKERLQKEGFSVSLVNEQTEVPVSDICFLLSCTRIVKSDFLMRNRHNIVVHASNLPKGKGFTPAKWQILEGSNRITLTLFEAVEAIDAGPYYIKKDIVFSGYELMDEIHEKLAETINTMCVEYIKNIEKYRPINQVGEETFFKRFTEEDDKLDIDKSIRQQFNHFRIADNENHPLWFEIDGHKYNLKIEKRT